MAGKGSKAALRASNRDQQIFKRLAGMASPNSGGDLILKVVQILKFVCFNLQDPKGSLGLIVSKLFSRFLRPASGPE